MTLSIFTNHQEHHVIVVPDCDGGKTEYWHLKTVAGQDSLITFMREKEAEALIKKHELRSMLFRT